MKQAFLIIVSFWLAGWTLKAQQATTIIQRGNELYKLKQYDQAAAAYQEALDLDPGNTTALFNRANALYLQSMPDEAIRLLDQLAMKTTDPELKGKAYYNKGAIFSAGKKLEESIEAYKNALRNNPADTQARENLQKALLELKKKNPPPPPKDNKKNQQQQQQRQQPQMNPKEVEQRLKLLEQKEKEVRQRLQNEKSKTGGAQQKDW